MIAVTDGYYIDVSGDGCYTVMKFAGTTADGLLEEPELLEEQKSIELKERSISLLVSR